MAKVQVLLGLTVGICVPYFTLQRLGLFPERGIPELFIDRSIAFDPAWTPVYLSVCALVPLSVLLAERTEQLARFARALAGLCVICFAGFVLLPAAGPRPGADVVAGLEGSYPWLVSVDGARNAFPSLHAGLTVLCMSFALRVSRAPRPLRIAAWAFAAAILYSTLATKQHFALDVFVGAGLGGLAYATNRPATASSRDTQSSNPAVEASGV